MRTARLLTVSQHALRRWGVCPGGVCPVGICPWRCGRPPCEWNDWQTGVKTLPCRNFVAGGNKYNWTCKVCDELPQRLQCVWDVKLMSSELYSKYEGLFNSHHVFLNFNYKLQLLVNRLKGYVDGSFEIKKNRIHRIQFLRGLQQRHREVGK